ncbi:MAG: hypothetical protein HYY78_03930 [Betaproteobacteria bacterium]|nr:hypothetical protein [Betaproteobacteria bacterium]
MALNLFGGGKVDHPMADPKRAREIVSELPANNASKALEEIVEWLESLTRTEGFKLDRRLEVVDMLDGAAKNHQRKVAQEYLSLQRNQKYQENKLWNGAYGFWRQLGEAYVLCVKQHESGFSGAATVKKSLPMIVARAMRALTLQVKWTLLRYGPVEPRVFQEMSRLYQFAESQGFAESVIAVYPGAHGQGSVRQEFLKGLMLTASSTDGLTPARQDVAERAVAHFSGHFRMSKTPDALNYCFNLAEPRAPVRRITVQEAAPGLRYFGAGEGLPRLDALIGQIQQSGAVPADVDLGGIQEKNLVIGVLKHLAMYWSDKPPARSSERRATAGSVTVVPGFSEIFNTLDPASSDDLDFSKDSSSPATENWVIVNVSDGGYGAIVPPKKSEWLKVGTLVGLQSETSKHWGVGLVRRISSDEHQQRRVGVQLVTKSALPIKVGKSGAGAAASDLQPAILLSTAPDAKGEVGVILREGLFNGRDSLDMLVRDKGYLLMPASMVEDGDDFDWARFKVMQRSA